MTETVGAFLKQKLSNMAGWLTEEIGKENLSIDLYEMTSNVTELQVTYLAELLYSKRDVIVHRSWQGLVAITQDLPATRSGPGSDYLDSLIQSVRSNPHLHDKFWRYMELFASVVNSNE